MTDRGERAARAIGFKAVWFVGIWTVTMGLLLSGCGGEVRTFPGSNGTSQMGRVSKEELAVALNAFDESASQVMRETAQTLYELAPDQQRKRTDVIKSIRLTQAFQSMLAHEDPVVAFVETWGLAVRLVDYFQTGHGQALYSEHHDVVVRAAKGLEMEIEEIGRKFLSEEEFEDARTQVTQFARQQPMNESFSNLIVYATAVRPGEPSPFAGIVSIPMAPFTAMKGVDRTASAIYGVRGSMERMSDIVDDLPESVRWQLLLLLMDLEEVEAVKSLLNSASTFSESSVRLAAMTEALPEELRRQASALVEEIDGSQKNTQVTLDKAEATATAFDKSLVTAQGTLEKAGQTAEGISQMAQEWESAIEATDDLIKSVKQWSDSKPKKAAGQAPTVQDYQETIRDVAHATNELRALVVDARDLTESEALTARIGELNGCAVAVVDRSAVQARGLADHIAWRLIQLAGVIALLALAYRFVSLYFLTKLG